MVASRVKAALLFALCALSSCRQETGAPFEPPFAANLLFISMDTTRADHLSVYGYHRDTSPRLAALARDAHVFDSAYTVMPTTLPSHASMFTSRFPAQLGVTQNGDRVPDDVDTLAERLSAAGFVTGAFVSATPLAVEYNLGQGFDTYQDAAAITRRRAPEARADQVRARTLAWLREHRDQRSFCFMHLFDPHTWYDPPPAHRRAFGVPDGPLPPAREFLQLPEPLPDTVVQASIAAYDAEIRFADEQIGRLLDEMRAMGLLKNTIIVFLSDHGETLDELLSSRQYGFDHGEFLYRREVRIPLIIRLPDGFPPPPAARHARTVTTLDVMPTLLELLGVQPDPKDSPLQGTSLLPLLRGGSLPPGVAVSQRRTLNQGDLDKMPHLSGDEFSVIWSDWHWIHADNRDDELFQLASDPHERSNVIDDDGPVRDRMYRLLTMWRQLHGAGRAPERVDDAELDDLLEQLGYTTGGSSR